MLVSKRWLSCVFFLRVRLCVFPRDAGKFTVTPCACWNILFVPYQEATPPIPMPLPVWQETKEIAKKVRRKRFFFLKLLRATSARLRVELMLLVVLVARYATLVLADCLVDGWKGDRVGFGLRRVLQRSAAS